jgi:anthranilate-CoA ligase
MELSQFKSNLTQTLLFDEENPKVPIYYYRDKIISRQELQIQVRKLASLFESIIEPGDYVIICLNDSPSLVTAFLSCVAIGAIPSVLNPKAKNFTLNGVVDNCQPKFIITDFNKARSLPHWDDTEFIIASDIDSETFSDFDLGTGTEQWNNFYLQEPSDVCYLQYTSGSTGIPKGVMHSINSTLGFCRAVANEFLSLNGNHVAYSIPKMFFGYGMGNSMFFPLFSGSAAVLDNEWPTPDKILVNLQQYKPNVFYAAPAIYQMLQSNIDVVKNSVKIAVSAGAFLPAEAFQFWLDHGIEICDGIGATEIGHIFLANQPQHALPGVTGRVLPEYQCKLVDNNNQVITLTDRQGVLLVKGPSVSQGYLGQPDKTAASFNDGWYRTGDVFTVDIAGNYRYFGREDDMFKIKGRWVTPAYIEQAISKSFPNVIESALVPTCRQKDTIKPTLFLVGDDVVTQAVHDFVVDSFESHMQPQKVINIQGLPRNDNGKVVRAKLIDLAIHLEKEKECVS